MGIYADDATVEARRAFEAGRIAGISVATALKADSAMLAGLVQGLVDGVDSTVPFRMQSSAGAGVMAARTEDWLGLYVEIRDSAVTADVKVRPLLTSFFATLLLEIGSPGKAAGGGKATLVAEGEVIAGGEAG